MSNKDLKYYKYLTYNIIVEKQEIDGETWFIAFTNELGKFACYGRGETQIEALNSFMVEKDVFIEYLFSEGKEIPEPKNDMEIFIDKGKTPTEIAEENGITVKGNETFNNLEKMVKEGKTLSIGEALANLLKNSK